MKKFLLYLLSAIVAFAGCTPDTVEGDLFVNVAEEFRIAGDGGNIIIEVTTEVDWNLLSSESWATPFVRSNEDGIKSVIVTINSNPNFEERSAIITIENVELALSHNVTIVQSGVTPDCSNVIAYTSSDEKIVTPSDVFSANIVSNTYDNGQGLIIFDAPVTSIGENAFYYCSSLTSVTIPDSVTSIGELAFFRCSLTSVTIPDSVTSIGYGAFADCRSLTSVYISDLSAWYRIDFANADANPLCYGKKLYLNGSELSQISIPSDITEIKPFTFYNCDSLTSVIIPDSVTSIGNAAFNGCSSLPSVTIPNSVTSIGRYAFSYCSSLTSIYCKPTTPPAGRGWMFYNNASDRKIYVPTASVDAYKVAEYWSDYASSIVGYNF